MAFVDHSFHKLSRSGDFLRDLFSEHFRVTNYWDDSWNGGGSIPFDELSKYEYVFFFQIIHPQKNLRKIKSKIIWAPMYDSEKFNHSYWMMISALAIKIMSFSEKIHEQCIKYNVDSLPLKYYRNPDDYRYPQPQKGNHFFFWYRGGIGFDDIKKIIDPNDVDSFIYKSTPDPTRKRESISEEDKKIYKLKILETDFIPEEEYRGLFSQYNIFISPRKKEGIGMSFLEAIAAGKCVVGYNDATMNEYITNNETGYLFTEESGKLDLTKVQGVISRSYTAAKNGYTEWQRTTHDIPIFITSNPSHKRKRLMWFFWYTLNLRDTIITRLNLILRNKTI